MPSPPHRRVSRAWDSFSRGRWWRPLLALPQTIYGVAVLAGAGAVYGQRTGAAIAAVLWLAGSLIALARPGERALLELAKWRPIQLETEFSPAVRDELHAVVGSGELATYDFYVIDHDLPTAFAVGGHSIGVTTLLLDRYRQGLVADEHVVAVILHELGHHHGGAVRLAALQTYLVFPWLWTRALARVLAAGVSEAVRSSLFAALFMGLLLLGVLTAIWMIAQPHLLLVLSLTLVTALLGVGLAALHGAFSRAEELRADAFAAAHGYGPSLVAYLQWFEENSEPTPSRWSRRFHSHPPLQDRIAHLDTLLY